MYPVVTHEKTMALSPLLTGGRVKGLENSLSYSEAKTQNVLAISYQRTN